MKPEDHIKRYKQMRTTLHDLMSKPIQEKDNASIVTIAHWASYHLVSTIIDQLNILERLKHRNHRGIKKSLKSLEVKEIIGDQSIKILDLYNKLESNFLSKYQYGRIDKELNDGEMKELLVELEEICKKITDKIQRDH